MRCSPILGPKRFVNIVSTTNTGEIVASPWFTILSPAGNNSIQTFILVKSAQINGTLCNIVKHIFVYKLGHNFLLFTSVSTCA